MHKKMCKSLESSIAFNDSRILFCTLGNLLNNREMPVIKDNYNGEPIDWDNLNLIRKQSRIQLPSCCENCIQITDTDVNEEPQEFEYILFSNWSRCNSRCIYCFYGQKTEKDTELITNIKSYTKKVMQTEDTDYDIAPIIQDAIDRNLITNKTVIDIAGGEPTLYYNIDKAIELLINANVKRILVNSNLIQFNKTIAKGISKGIINLIFSIDAGTKQVHEKIKRVKTYDIVYKNAKKYSSYKKNIYSNKIISKYIIIPDYNDKKQEIDIWIEKSKQIGVSHLAINIDGRIFDTKNEPNITNNIIDLCEYFKNRCETEKLNFMLYPNIDATYKMRDDARDNF